MSSEGLEVGIARAVSTHVREGKLSSNWWIFCCGAPQKMSLSVASNPAKGKLLKDVRCPHCSGTGSSVIVNPVIEKRLKL